MSKDIINMRKEAKVLKYLPEYELERICKEVGMNQRQLKATMDYIYHEKSVKQIIDELGMSLNTFQVKKEILAMRVSFYLKDTHHPLADLL